MPRNLRNLALPCIVALTGLAMPAASQAADVTVTAFGGAWEQAFRKCYAEPYEKKTGQTVEVIIGGPPQWVNQIAANPNDPPIDVLVNLMDTARTAINQGLVEELDEAKVPNLAAIPSAFREPLDGFGTVINYGAAGLAYNKETVEEPPQSWQDFVQGTLDGKWVATLPGINVANTTPTALLWNLIDLYGSDIGDIDTVMAKLVELRDSGNVVFYNDMNQFLTLIQSGEADIGIYWDGRAWVAHDTGLDVLDFYYPAPGGIISPSVIQKVKNGSENGWAFIDALLSPEAQGCFAHEINYAVVNPDVEYREPLKSRVPSWQDVRWPPFSEIAERMPQWVDTWNRQVGQ